jgi:hypothetical protein
MKNTLLFTGLFFGCSLLSWSQNDPTIDDMYFENGNNFCYSGSYNTLVVIVTDSDGDVVNVDNIVFTNTYLDYFQSSVPETVGNTTTFYFDVFSTGAVGIGLVETESMDVTVSSISVVDPTNIDAATMGGLVVNGQVFVEFTVPVIETCNNALPLDLNQYVNPVGGYFNWAESATTFNYTYNSSNVFDPKKAYQVFEFDGGDGYYLQYYAVNANGCEDYVETAVNFNEAPEINMTPTNANCGSADGSALATITGFGAPYDVYWSTGKAESVSGTTTITNVSSGVYYLNVTDSYGCKAVKNANISDNDFTVTPTITESRCLGQPGTVDLNISIGAGSVDNIYWSNGQSSNILTAGPGEYSVAVHSTGNCNFFGTYEIADSALRVKLEDVYPNYDCLTTPSGYIDISTVGGTGLGTYAWAWDKDGVPGFSTNQDIFGIEGGVYKCTVTDMNGCSLTWSKTIENPNNVWLWTESVTQPTCGNSDGAIDIFVDEFGDVPTFYEWSTGATTEDLTGVPAGNYTLTYTDASGCTNYLTVKLTNVKPYQPSICLLTVDTSLIYNMVVWEKDPSQDIDGFNIYRETSVFGEFEKIVQRSYDLESFFQDNDASPVNRSWRYYITSYDACGGESYPSFIHKTIHVVASTSDGIDFDLSWDDYEGIAYTTVDLFRYDYVNGWTNIANLPYGTNSYGDTPPVVSGLDYMVSFNLTDACTSTKAQDHNSSRSNKTASTFNPGGSTAEIVDTDLGYISIYPNPANSFVILHLDNPELFQTYEVLDLNGKVIATEQVLTNNNEIDLTNFANGIYMIRLVSDSKIIVEKFVKN